MIKVDNLSYSFPQRELFRNISFILENGQHCALIGTSGSGKSTLINILRDPEKYMYDGKLEISSGSRIGYVSQFSQLDNTAGMTVFEYIGEEFIKIQNELAVICAQMAASSDEASSDVCSLLEEYQQTVDAFNAIDGDNFESNIHKKLDLAKLSRHKSLSVSELSGGEYKLVQVIKEMLTHPDVIIMDEPDVYLDFENLNGLKDLINSHKGIMLVVTHNRYLLNYCFNKILHLENGEIQEFDGRYINYKSALLQRKVELQELAIADNQEIERNAVLTDKLRFIATNNSEAAKGKSLNARVKIQERLEARRVKAPFVDIKQPDISFATVDEAGETIALKVVGYSVSFDEVLLENVNFEINATDKVAVIGSNGAGENDVTSRNL